MAVREKYSLAKADKHQKQKQEEAKTRAAARAERTDKQQLALLDARGWKAAKERARLQTN